MCPHAFNNISGITFFFAVRKKFVVNFVEFVTLFKFPRHSTPQNVRFCKCESGNIKVPVIDKDPVVIRQRFMDEIRKRNG